MIDTPQKKLHVEAPYKTKVNSISCPPTSRGTRVKATALYALVGLDREAARDGAAALERGVGARLGVVQRHRVERRAAPAARLREI